MKASTFLRAAAIALCVLPLLPSSHAQSVWNTPVNISGDSDVLTNGTLVYAYAFGVDPGTDTSHTVNGVTFNPFSSVGLQTSVTVGDVTLSAAPNTFYGNITSAASGAFTNLTSEYQAILASSQVCNFDTLTLTLGGLTPGKSYQVQLWNNYSEIITPSSNFDTTFSVLTMASGNTSSSVIANTGGFYGEVGQYLVGTVTLGAGQDSILLSVKPSASGNKAQINAFQVRELVAIPEPGLTCAAVGVFTLALVARRRLHKAS